MNNRMRVGVLILALSALMAGAAANAYDYDESSYYNQIERVNVTGDVTFGFAWSQNAGYLDDTYSDGNSVLVRTRHYQCLFGCQLQNSDITDDVENTTVYFDHDHATGNKVETWACAQMGWPIPDSCTDTYTEYE